MDSMVGLFGRLIWRFDAHQDVDLVPSVCMLGLLLSQLSSCPSHVGPLIALMVPAKRFIFESRSVLACAQVKALRMLAGVAAMLLTRFPTTLEQDRRALEDPGGLAPDVRAAVQFRAEKKAVLSEALQDIAHRIRVRPNPSSGVSTTTPPEEGSAKRIVCSVVCALCKVGT